MRLTILSLVAAICTIPSAVLADVNELTCSVTVQDTRKELQPRSEWGRAFSAFTLDPTRDPKGWEHQNRCVSARDFRGAAFAGQLCLVVITGAGSEDPSAPVNLVVDISRDAIEADKLGSTLPSGSRSRGAAVISVPFDSRGDRLYLQHTFATKGARGDLYYVRISCQK